MPITFTNSFWGDQPRAATQFYALLDENVKQDGMLLKALEGSLQQLRVPLEPIEVPEDVSPITQNILEGQEKLRRARESQGRPLAHILNLTRRWMSDYQFKVNATKSEVWSLVKDYEIRLEEVQRLRMIYVKKTTNAIEKLEAFAAHLDQSPDPSTIPDDVVTEILATHSQIEVEVTLGQWTPTPKELSQVLMRAREELPCQTRRILLLSYKETFAAMELVCWLQTQIPQLVDFEQASEAVKQLIEEYKVIELCGRVGASSFNLDPSYFYIFRPEAFHMTKARRRAQSLSPLVMDASNESDGPRSASLMASKMANSVSNLFVSSPTDPSTHQAAQKAATKAEESYRQSLTRLESARLVLESRWDSVLRSMQVLERGRLETLADLVYRQLEPLRAGLCVSEFNFDPAQQFKDNVLAFATGPYRPDVQIFEGDRAKDLTFGADLEAQSQAQEIAQSQTSNDTQSYVLPETFTILMDILHTITAQNLEPDTHKQMWTCEVELSATHAVRQALIAGASSEDLLDNFQPYHIAAVFKLWLLELQGALLPVSLVSDLPTETLDESALRSALSNLPVLNLLCLAQLCQYFTSLDGTLNDMEWAKKLQYTLGPCLTQCSSGPDSEQGSASLFAALIKHNTSIQELASAYRISKRVSRNTLPNSLPSLPPIMSPREGAQNTDNKTISPENKLSPSSPQLLEKENR